MNDTIEFYRQLLDNLNDGVYFVDRDRTILYWNKGAERLTGFTGADVIGSHCWDHIISHVNDLGTELCSTQCILSRCITDGAIVENESYLHHKEGYRIPVSVRVMPMRNGEGEIVGAAEIFCDNTVRTVDIQKIDELRQMVFLDPLTGIANRRYVEMNLQSRFEEMFRYGWEFGVLMMDLDHFKLINDCFGHDVGDDALRTVTKTLLNSSRAFDIIGRWGGEEFIAVITNVSNDKLYQIAERYRHLVENSTFSANNNKVAITVSIGATMATSEDTVGSLIKRSDELMYKSKADGRNRVTTDAI